MKKVSWLPGWALLSCWALIRLSGAPDLVAGELGANAAGTDDTPPVYNEEVELLDPEGQKDDRFGIAVAISGERVLVGEDGDDELASNCGSALVFERDEAGNWIQVAKLLPSDGAANDRFGSAVALEGDRAVVGAWAGDDLGFDAGVAYVFERDEAGFWVETAKLVASDGRPEDHFGFAVSLSGDRILVGAHLYDVPGSRWWSWYFRTAAGQAYIFERDGSGNWAEVARLRAGDAKAKDHFGMAVAISGNRALVGAQDEALKDTGAAYLFQRTPQGKWVQGAKLLGSDVKEYQRFGAAVALAGERAIVGSLYGAGGGAYIFERDEQGHWPEVAALHVPDLSYYGQFGQSVALAGDRVLVGDPFRDDLGSNSGAAFVYERDEQGQWQAVAELLPSDGVERDYFATSVGLAEGYAAAGAHAHDDLGSTSGAAYLFPVVPW